MPSIKDQLVKVIVFHADCRTAELAGELLRTRSQDKEPILAELQFQRWLAETCRVSQGGP